MNNLIQMRTKQKRQCELLFSAFPTKMRVIWNIYNTVAQFDDEWISHLEESYSFKTILYNQLTALTFFRLKCPTFAIYMLRFDAFYF